LVIDVCGVRIGFSFKGEVREPFGAVIQALRDTKLPVMSVDVPSGWDVDNGPPDSGPGKGFYPDALVSLTAPKPLVKACSHILFQKIANI
jgi:NAD(P)H-hydrate epimerase